MKDRRQNIPSKMAKTRVVLRSRELTRYVPVTRLFHRETLRRMLEMNGMVYVKPDIGSLGIGVIKVEKKGRGYSYQSGTRRFNFPSFPALFRSLQQRIGRRRYLVQKGIHVLRHGNRPFDFRVMIQRGPSRRWEPTGIAGRVAHPYKIVTNGSQGGTIYPAGALLTPHGGKAGAGRIIRLMNRIARVTAAQLSRTYPALNELGLDVAIDRRLRPWILEVNTSPDPCPFTKLPDRRMIRKIVAYARGYGKRYRLVCNKAKRAPATGRKR